MTRRLEAIVLSALAVGVVAAGIAWACTPSAEIVVSPSQGRSGDAATVTGTSFRDGPVSLHWDSPSGPVVGTGAGPSFSTGITIPESNSGGHYVVAIQEGGGTATASYSVLADPPAPAPVTQPGGGSNSPSFEPSRGGSGSPGGGRLPDRADTGGSVTDSTGGFVTDSPEAAAGLPSGLGPETSSASSRADANARGAEGSARSAVSDLWGAFARPRDAAESGLAGPAASGGGDSSLLPAGMAMLTIGLLALVGGFGAAAARHRRAGAG
jgi:hypothetical protein